MSDRELASIRGRRVAMIYQDPLTALNPVLRIGDQLVEAIRLHSPLSKAAARTRAIELLGQVGLSQPASRIDAYPHEFSGGMRQRVMIAMALSGDPEVLIADEPTTALDVTTQARILALLDDLVSERGISVLLITHDLGIAAGFCDRVHVMYAGRIVERSDVFSIYANPLHPYSEALLAAVCRLDIDISHEIPAIPGYPPSPTALPQGCVFNPRCPYREPICLTDPPDDVIVGERMAACHFTVERHAPGEPAARRAAWSAAVTSDVASPGRRAAQAVPRRPRYRRPGCRRSLVRRRPGRDARPRRRVRLGQVDDRELRARPHEGGRRHDRVQRSVSGRASAHRDANGAPLADRGLPGPVGLAQPAAYGRQDRRRPPRGPRHRQTRRARRDRVVELLELVGLGPEFLGRRPSEMSGGQCQRVAIARALATEPSLVVLDEAVSSLDVSIQAQVLNLLRQLQRENDLAFLFISHDLAVVRFLCTRVAVMYRGRIVETGPREVLFGRPLHPYTHTLMRAIPVVDPVRARELISVTPAAQGAIDMPTVETGCRFRALCPIGRDQEICRTVDPELRTIEADHAAACHFPQVALDASVPEGTDAGIAAPVRPG